MSGDSKIEHDREARRFRLERQGRYSHLAYRQVDTTTLDFTSTWVDPALRGHGLGAHLVLRALEWAEAEGYRVVPSCWFVREVMERHPRYLPLVADPARR